MQVENGKVNMDGVVDKMLECGNTEPVLIWKMCIAA